MQLKLRAEDSTTKHGAPTLMIHDFTLHMVTYTFLPNREGKASPSGRIEVSQLDEAIKGANEFMNGHCGFDERFACHMMIALFQYCKECVIAVTWKM